MTILTVPQYDAIVLPDNVAYPVTREDARRLVRALTSRDDCSPLDWESMGEATFGMGGETFKATFECAGEWPDPERHHEMRVRMLVAVTNVHITAIETERRTG